MMLQQKKLEHLALARLFIPENTFGVLYSTHTDKLEQKSCHVPRRIFKKEKGFLTLKPKKFKVAKSFVSVDDAAAK